MTSNKIVKMKSNSPKHKRYLSVEDKKEHKQLRQKRKAGRGRGELCQMGAIAL